MRKPYRKPYRPIKKTREEFFSQNRKFKKKISLDNKSRYKTSLSAEAARDALAKLSEEDLPFATIKAPYGRASWWYIVIEREWSDKELSKKYSDHLDKYEEDMIGYRKELEIYNREMQQWKQHEVERIKAQAERQIKNVMES